MTLYQQMVFKIWLAIGAQAAFAIQIEAPQEIAEQVSIYSSEAGAKNENMVLKVSIEKNKHCSNYSLKLINKNGRTIKEIERCSADLPNAALQSAVFEIFGRHPAKNENKPEASGNAKTILFGAGFALAGILLYYSNPPKPVYGHAKNETLEASK